MKLTTPIPLQSPDLPLTYGSRFFNLGSCFADNLANKLHYFGFTTHQNPIGVLFHPFAIHQFCNWLNGEAINENLFTEDNGIWKSLQAHSQVHAETSEKLLLSLQKQVEAARNYLTETDAIFITYGTAFAYQNLSTKKYVANCQKQNASLFQKELIKVEALVEAFEETIQVFSKFSKAKVYVSISPVRHLKDGLIENNLSKAHLLTAVHEVVSNHHHVNYFPAYEIVLDELRDYRFYNRDLLHPNELAIDYVWEKFSTSFFDEATLQTIKKVNQYRKLSAHRPMLQNENVELAHQAKLASLKQKLVALEPRLQID